MSSISHLSDDSFVSGFHYHFYHISRALNCFQKLIIDNIYHLFITNYQFAWSVYSCHRNISCIETMNLKRSIKPQRWTKQPQLVLNIPWYYKILLFKCPHICIPNHIVWGLTAVTYIKKDLQQFIDQPSITYLTFLGRS
jgi:hypothetical protein